MWLTNNVKFSKSFYKNYKRMHLITGVYSIPDIPTKNEPPQLTVDAASTTSQLCLLDLHGSQT